MLQEKGIALVSPRDTKAPRVLIPLKDCPEGNIFCPFFFCQSVHMSWEVSRMYVAHVCHAGNAPCTTCTLHFIMSYSSHA